MLTNHVVENLKTVCKIPFLNLLVTFFTITFLTINNASAESPQPTDIPAKNPENASPATQSGSKANAETVKRAQFTTAIVDREPTDDVVMLTNNSEKIYYFSELTNLKGHKVTHRWKYQGKLMAEIKFNVKSDRWRVYSSKNIKPDWTGDWTVELVDENGTSLDVSKLEVVEAKTQQ